jgi:hypothetical protein
VPWRTDRLAQTCVVIGDDDWDHRQMREVQSRASHLRVNGSFGELWEVVPVHFQSVVQKGVDLMIPLNLDLQTDWQSPDATSPASLVATGSLAQVAGSDPSTPFDSHSTDVSSRLATDRYILTLAWYPLSCLVRSLSVSCIVSLSSSSRLSCLPVSFELD